MKINKKKATLYNIITMFLYQFIAVIVGFILPKLLLEKYGADTHGYTSTVTNIMNYVSLLNAGLSVAAIQSLYKPLAENDEKEINSVLNAIRKFYNQAGILYLIAIVIISIFLPLFIKGDISKFEIIALMLIMGLSNTIECFCYAKNMVLLQSNQKIYVVNLINAISLLIRSLIQIVLIKTNNSIIIIETVPTIMVFFRAFILEIYTRKKYTFLNSKIIPNKNALSKRWSAFTHQISSIIVNNTDIVLLNIFTNLTIVSIYSVYNLVFSHLYKLMNMIFTHGTVASFGAVINEKNDKKLNKSYDIYELGYYFVTIIVYSITSVMILSFVKIYTKGVDSIHYVDIKLAILFIIISVMSNLRVPCGTLISAAGHFKETQSHAIIEAIINIVLSLLLVKPLGMYGLLIGTICSFSYRTIDIICYSNKNILHRNCLISFKRVIIVVIGIIGSVSVYAFLKLDFFQKNWLDWFLHCIIIGIISFILATILFLIFENKKIKTIYYSILEKCKPYLNKRI